MKAALTKRTGAIFHVQMVKKSRSIGGCDKVSILLNVCLFS